MRSSAKRKILVLNEENTDQDSVSDIDSQPTKKGKRDCSPEGGVRHDFPTTTRYLPLAIGGLHWRGKMSLENVVVFGDSCSRSSEEDAEPNTGIDHFLGRQSKPPIRIHNFAFPGATAEDDLLVQFSRFRNISRDLPLEGENAVYFFYLGTNDCGRTSSDELEQIVETIFDTLHGLCVTAGARNFVLIDVPPIDRSPGAVESDSTEDIKERVETWNKLLRIQAKDFAEGSEKATIFVFSSHRVLTEVLDEPLNFDFVEEDPETEGGSIWTDNLHLTPAVHAILADRLLDSLTK